MYNIDRFCLYY